MNRYADSRALHCIKDAVNKRKRRQDDEYRAQEQSANRNARAIARRDEARRDEENEQRHTRREQPGVLEHKAIQCSMAREEPGRRKEEQEANTARWRARREQPGRRDEENEQRHTRCEQPGVLEHEALQRSIAREEPGRREEEQEANTARRCAKHEQPGRRDE